MTRAGILSRTVVAISAYRSDRSVVTLLEKLFRDGGQSCAAVIVVDSLNDGSLARVIAQRGWQVRYENADRNLGSAGNLARRLQLASAVPGAEWCYAVNHDGMIERATIEQMIECGEQEERTGAVYPNRRMIGRGNSFLRPHSHLLDMPSFADRSDGDPSKTVAWDSSNGALYRLAAVRQGIVPWSELWMGWEDLVFGWQLAAGGWQQRHCVTAVFDDDYEYDRKTLLGYPIFITCKPSWYSYYTARNLILFVRRSRIGVLGWMFVLRRVAREFGLTLLFRSQKRHRLSLLLKGLVDGWRGITGIGRGFSA